MNLSDPVFTDVNLNRWGWIITRSVYHVADNLYRAEIRTQNAAHPAGEVVSHDATLDDGVIRWTSNGRVAPLDAVRKYGLSRIPGFDEARHRAAYTAEIDAFVAAYRAADPHLDGEALSEARAAFGPDARVVNVLTGRQTRLF